MCGYVGAPNAWCKDVTSQLFIVVESFRQACIQYVHTGGRSIKTIDASAERPIRDCQIVQLALYDSSHRCMNLRCNLQTLEYISQGWAFCAIAAGTCKCIIAC